jgi:hypothetical protein
VRDLLAAIGVIVVFLSIMGALGIGEFRLYYGDDPHGCTKIETKLSKDRQ